MNKREKEYLIRKEQLLWEELQREEWKWALTLPEGYSYDAFRALEYPKGVALACREWFAVSQLMRDLEVPKGDWTELANDYHKSIQERFKR